MIEAMCQAVLRGMRNIARNRGRGILLIVFLSLIIGLTVVLLGVNVVVTRRLQAFGSGIGTLIELRPLADFMGASMGPSAPELRLDVGLKLEHADVYVLTG